MNFALHKKRKKLKPTCHILTITQIRKLGKLLELPSLANAMESFMEPSNLFSFSKAKLAVIHQYLLDNKLTRVKQPPIQSRQQDHGRLLIDFIYPGYPIGTAKEQACRKDRESRPTFSKKGAIYFAYDQLPTKDSFERWEELLRLETPLVLESTPALPPSSPSPSSSTYRYTINMQKLERNSAGSTNQNIRLHMYIWMSPRYSLLPHLTSLKFDGVESWCEKDQEIVTNRFKYIDITDKFNWDLVKTRDEKTVEMEFELDDSLVSPTVKYVTICSVWEKSSIELVCQLYTKTAANYISSAMAMKKDIDQTQSDAIQLLDQCRPKDRWCLEKTETLFLDCGRTFYRRLASEEDDDTDDELTMGNEYISLMDPILLTKVNHPARGIFCRHATCFDAKCFFQCYIPQQLWTCPICHIQIRGIQDLYIDYDLKLAIATYPEQNRFILSNDGTYLTESQYQQPMDQPPLPSHRPLSPLILKQQPSLSPAPPSPLLLSCDKRDHVELLDDLDTTNCHSMIEQSGKRMKIDLLDDEPVMNLE
ncbi:unnamed protein product [Absidia cylindrospora]